MKKYIKKLLAGLMILAMIFGCISGIGVSEVKAAAEEDEDGNYISFDIKVTDENNTPVNGLELQLYRKDSYEGESILNFESPTNGQGETSYKCNDEEMYGAQTIYYELQLKAESGYEISQPLKVWFGEGYEDEDFNVHTCIDYINNTNSYYDGETVPVQVKKTGGDAPEPVVEDRFLEGKVAMEDGSPIAETISLQLEKSIISSDEPVVFDTEEDGQFKVKINDLDDAQYNLKPVAGSKYKCVGDKPMTITFDSRTEDGQKIKYVSKVNNEEYTDGEIILSVVDDSSSAVTKAAAKVKSISENGGIVVVTVTGKNLPDKLYYKKYYVRDDMDGDLSSSSEKPQEVLAQGNTDTEKTIEVSLPNARVYLGEEIFLKAVAWKIGVDVSADGMFLANARTGNIEIEKEKQPDEEDGKEEDNNKDDDNNKEDNKGDNKVEDNKDSTTVKEDIKVAKITISGISKKIAAGKKLQLTAKVTPSNATNKAVIWSTSNKKYATVDSKGKVSVKKAGAGKTVTITAKAADGSGVRASYKIQIKKDTVKSIKLKAKKSVKAGKSLRVAATVKTTGKKANKKLKWTSSNTKYAVVSAKGVVKTKRAGKGKKVKITAKATDGSNKKATIMIKIK